MAFDIEALLVPIPGDRPAGPDLRAETGLDSVYFKLKDARAQARMTERTAEAAGESPTVAPAWRTVRDLALDALGSRSKDVEVAAWLLEAELRTEGFAGFAAAATLIDRLVQRFWPDLHSIDEDDAAGRLSPLAGLNGIGGEGALVQPIRMVPLLPDVPYGTHALWHLSRVRKDPNGAMARDFSEARATTDGRALQERVREAGAARDAYLKLTTTLEVTCGADAPPSSNIRNALDEVVEAFRSLGGEVEVAPEVAPAPEAAAEAVEVAVAAPAPVFAGPRPLASREDAFAELLRVADFFRRNEPHSPISYALETLVWRGRMSFIDLLEELMPDGAQRKQLLQHAGIHTGSENRKG